MFVSPLFIVVTDWQVNGTNEGTSCSAGQVLQVLMEMERERERREEVHTEALTTSGLLVGQSLQFCLHAEWVIPGRLNLAELTKEKW